jgi:hypothetical protein
MIMMNKSLELVQQVYLLRNLVFHGVYVLFVGVPQLSGYHGPSYPQNSEFADPIRTTDSDIYLEMTYIHIQKHVKNTHIN